MQTSLRINNCFMPILAMWLFRPPIVLQSFKLKDHSRPGILWINQETKCSIVPWQKVLYLDIWIFQKVGHTSVHAKKGMVVVRTSIWSVFSCLWISVTVENVLVLYLGLIKGTSVYSYIKACWCVLLLIAHVGHVHCLSDLRCGQVDTACMGSTSDVLVCGNPAVRYVVITVTIEVGALWCYTYADCLPHK